jgi:hypothetical protein
MAGARPWRSKLAEAFRREGVMTLDEVREALGGVSEVTARRRLAAFRYRSSYNHNGRYYTLYEEKRCDGLGLWSHSGIRFSRDGSLTATARRLVQESEAGHSQRELQEILGVRVQNTLMVLVERGELKREQLGGTFVYLHADEETIAAQVEKRHERLAAIPEAQASFEAVIQILLVLIRHPGCDETSVARRLKGRSPPIGLDAVRWVFRRYELEQKRGLQSS